MSEHMTYCVGIDGGGTKTEGVLADVHGHVLARRCVGATNPNDVGEEASVHILAALVAALIEDADADGQCVSPCNVTVFAGISGALNHIDMLLAALCEKMPEIRRWDVGSDVINLLSGELPEGDGACLICGTGSACFLRRKHTLFRIGGWGYLLDSVGSGYDMGRMAMEAVLRAYDGRGEPTLLTQLLCAHLGGNVWDKLTDIYREGKTYIASCAPLVFEAARRGDPMAQYILDRNAQGLADCIRAAHKRLEDVTENRNVVLPVVLGGGIAQKEAPAWTDRIRSLLGDLPVVLTVATSPMVLGAVVEARKRLACSVPMEEASSFQENFLATYPKFL